jgi:hypothetical protein
MRARSNQSGDEGTILMSKSALQCVLTIVALLCPIDLTMADDRPTDAQCRNFATFAVQNAQKVRSLYCTTLPWNDSSLSLDWKKQYNFCMSVRTETVEVRMEVLVAQSDKCYYCRRFEDAVLALQAIARDRQCQMKDFSRHPDRWEHSSKPESQRAHAMCMASEKVIGDSHHYDADSVKPQLDAILADMAYELESCEWRRRSREQATFQLSVVPKCAACHDSKRSTAASPAALQPGPKRVSTDPTIARQSPAFTPVPERRRTPRDSDRGTSSGSSDQGAPRGAPAGGSGSAMDRLGGGGTGGAPSGGGQSSGGAAKPSGSGGGAASGGAPSANNPAPNINSNTIMKQAPAFGQTPGLR